MIYKPCICSLVEHVFF